MTNRELSVERRIDAPVERGWETMIGRFEDWFCPHPWTAEARDVGDDTRFTATARHWTDEALEQRREMGFDGGWSTMSDRLKTLAEGGAL